MRRSTGNTRNSRNQRITPDDLIRESTANSADSNVPPFLDRFAPKVSWQDPNDLAPDKRNARTHSAKQISQIAASIEQFGFVNPVLIGEDGRIIAGHGRIAAAKILELDEVPVIRLDHLSESERRAFIIADNRMAELAGWDRELLAIELQELSEIDLGFDVEITGFETAEIDLLIENRVHDNDVTDPFTTPAEIKTPTTRPGDLWILGSHKILCGDTLDPCNFKQLMGDEHADMVFIDPPYNVPINGHVCGQGVIKHREFPMAAGEMTESEFIGFLSRALTNHVDCCRDGAVVDCFMDWRHIYELQVAARQTKLSMLNLCIWCKTNAGMGSLYRSQHELIAVLKKGNAPHINNIQLGRHGRYRTNIWTHEGSNTIRKSRRDELAKHPTAKPVALIADAIKDVTRRGDLILDGFAGIGSTLLAAQKTGRCCRAIEIDAVYVDIAILRWQELTREQAIHVENGRTFEELAESRRSEPVRRIRKRRKPAVMES